MKEYPLWAFILLGLVVGVVYVLLDIQLDKTDWYIIVLAFVLFMVVVQLEKITKLLSKKK